MKRKRIGLLAVYLVLGVQLLASGQATLHQQEVEPAFQDALDLFYKDQFAASREAFEQLRLHELSREKSIEVHYYQGLSSLRGDFPEGTSSLEAFVLDYPEEPLAHEAAWVLGNHYFTGRNYREAIENFGRLRGIPLSQERHPELLFKTGYSFFQLKNYSQAQNYFERAKRYKSPFLASAYYYAGFSAFQQKDFETAVTNFKEAEKSREFSLKVPYMLTALYYQQGDLPQVIAYAAPIIDKAGLEKREQVHLLLAEAYYADNAYEQAAYHYQSFVSAKKGALSRDQQYKAGVAHYEISQFQIASNFFKEVALLSDALGQVSSYFLGHAYIQLENLPFAANSFSAAYKMDFNPEIKEEALFNYAKVNLEMGKFQEAVTALDQYLNDYPRGTRFAQAEDLLSDALINTNNYLRAIQHMERMQQPSARIREAYQKVTFYQAMAYFRDNNPSGTLQLLDKSLRYPEDKSLQVLAQFWKGEANAVANKPEAAIQAYERVLAMNPPSSDPALIKTHYGLGYAYFNQGSYDKAERQFKAYTDKLRNNREKEQYHDALLRLGDVYYIQKKFDAAATTFQRAIEESSPYSDYAYFRGGVVANFQNRNLEAIRLLDQVANRFPNSLYLEDALFQKAQIHMEDLNYRQGREVFSTLIAQKPNSPFIPFALEGRAVANYSLKEYDQAIADYKKILDDYPNASNGETALVGLQESLSLQGRPEEFSTYLSEYRKSNPSSSNLENVEFEAAKSLVFNQSYEQAIRSLESFLRNYPNSSQVPEASYYLADAHYRQGSTDKALERYYQLENTSDINLKTRVFQKIAIIEFERENYAKAIPYFEFTAENARSVAEEYDAYSGLMTATFEIGNFSEAVSWADKIVALGNITVDAVPRALLIKGKSLESNGNPTEAAAAYRQLVENYTSEQGAEALYRLAWIRNQAGEYEASNELIFSYSQPFASYERWYGMQFVLLAKNYIAMDETFQAKATLESIVENSSVPEVVNEAEELLQTINTTTE